MTGSEGFKGSVHAAIGSLAATCCLYNALAYTQTRERRLAINVMVYALLWGWEQKQTWRHLSASKD